MSRMLILPGISHFGGQYNPKGFLDRQPALEYAIRRGYEGQVLDVSGETGPNSRQVNEAVNVIRADQTITSLYGFSGGGYNIRHILNRLSKLEKSRFDLIIVIGAPAVGGMSEEEWQANFAGDWELVYTTNPPQGHMAGPMALLDSYVAEQGPEKTA